MSLSAERKLAAALAAAEQRRNQRDRRLRADDMSCGLADRLRRLQERLTHADPATIRRESAAALVLFTKV